MHRLFYMYLLSIYCVCTCMHTHVQVYEVCSGICIDDFTCFYYLSYMYLHVYTHAGQGTTCQGCVCPSIMWILGIELWLSGLAASAFIY